MPTAAVRSKARCGHFEQVKAGSKWKCVACGELLTIEKSAQNSLELSDVMRSAFDNSRTLNESLDEVLGRKEWENMLDRIPRMSKPSKRTRK